MIIEAIAKAIENSDISRYQISKDTGIDQAVLCRLMQHSKGCISIETADKLCCYLGLELKPKARKGK
jgi:ribosome-binding protein aMBF1 (putative translation factor)